MKEGSGRWLKWTADLVYPRRCPFCDEVLAFGGPLICEDCRKRVGYVGESYCMKCGRLLSGAAQEYCDDCTHTGHSFDRGRSLYVYDDLTRASIAGFKYNGRKEYAEYYAVDIIRHLGAFIEHCRPDILIPVPISEKRRKKRGYNQSELIADRISERTGIPVSSDAVIRIKDTRPMKELSREERVKNLKGAFKIGCVDVQWKNALVVDDIYTTGSTVDAVAFLLRKVGIDKVFFIALSSGAPV